MRFSRRNPESLPVNAEELKKFAASAKSDEGILLDPWNTPYKAELSESGNFDVVMLSSAGPDKQFGTADDFAVTLVDRNVFAVPGARLNDLLSKAAMADRLLPATVDALKKLALDGGLNLDSAAQHTLQSNGKPYTYAIDVMRQFCFVNVNRDADETVWRSDGIDYFGRTEEKLSGCARKMDREQGMRSPKQNPMRGVRLRQRALTSTACVIRWGGRLRSGQSANCLTRASTRSRRGMHLRAERRR